MAMEKKIVTAATLAGFILATTMAHAATVYPITGKIMINQGNGYKEITRMTELKQGDIVMAKPGGTAKLNYSDGCSIQVKTGAIVNVGAQSPCASQASQQGQMIQTQAAPVPAPPAELPVEPLGAAGGGLGTGTLVAIGIGVAAAVGIGVAASSSGSSKKSAASP